MFIKVSVPGQFRLKMMPSFRSFLMHRDGEVHYIGGTDILPAPFDSVREAEVLRKFGTSEDKEARSALIEHNLRLVEQIDERTGEISGMPQHDRNNAPSLYDIPVEGTGFFLCVHEWISLWLNSIFYK